VTADANWSWIKELFQAAIERPPKDREAFLDERCGGDRTFRREVESLLAAHRDAGDFGELPVRASMSIPMASGLC
jgi:hypothetical protein